MTYISYTDGLTPEALAALGSTLALAANREILVPYPRTNMKTDIKFTVHRIDRAFAQEKTQTTEGRIDIERQQLQDELNELQQVEEQLTARVAAINEKLDLLQRVTVQPESAVL